MIDKEKADKIIVISEKDFIDKALDVATELSIKTKNVMFGMLSSIFIAELDRKFFRNDND